MGLITIKALKILVSRVTIRKAVEVHAEYQFQWADVGGNSFSSVCDLMSGYPLNRITLVSPDTEPLPNDDHEGLFL